MCKVFVPFVKHLTRHAAVEFLWIHEDEMALN